MLKQARQTLTVVIIGSPYHLAIIDADFTLRPFTEDKGRSNWQVQHIAEQDMAHNKENFVSKN